MTFDPLILSDQGRVALMDATRTYRRSLILRLWQNDFTPAPDSDSGDFQECDFPGYAPVTLTSWTTAFLNPAGLGQSTGPVVLFTRSAGGTPQPAYGAYVTDQAGNWVWANVRAGGPFTFAGLGDQLAVLPSLQDTSA